MVRNMKHSSVFYVLKQQCYSIAVKVWTSIKIIIFLYRECSIYAYFSEADEIVLRVYFLEKEINDTETAKVILPKEDILDILNTHASDSGGGSLTLDPDRDHFKLISVKEVSDPHHEDEVFWRTPAGYVTITVLSLVGLGLVGNMIYVAVDSYLFSRAGA